jgi:hypothetical protein
LAAYSALGLWGHFWGSSRAPTSATCCQRQQRSSGSSDGARRSLQLRTPDGRYIVVRGRLWRATNPGLSEPERVALVAALCHARRRLRATAPVEGRTQARHDVEAAKVGLGERGPLWWTDGAPDYNRRMVKNTPYAEWFASTGVG